jgi:hypothetical protein
MAAGVVMAVWLLVVGLVRGEGPAVVLGRFDPGGGSSPLSGALMHLAVAAFYGVGFALILRVLSGRRVIAKRNLWLLGAAFGLVLWLAAQFAVLPGLNKALAEIAPMVFLWAHLVYGITLGFILARHQSG